MSLIINTTVISNFAGVGQLDVLRQLFAQVYTTLDVFDEIREGLSDGYDFYWGIESLIYPLTDTGWIHLVTALTDAEVVLMSRLPPRLHRGEASCIAVAAQRQWRFLTDDRAARKEAECHGVQVSGTLGCLVQAVRRRVCSLEQANAWLRQMINDGGYRSPVDDLAALLAPL